MSLALFPLKSTKVLTPRTKINEEKQYAILKGSAETSWKSITTTSYSQSSIQFTCPPPSPGIIVDRKILVGVQFLLTFTGTARTGQYLLGIPQLNPQGCSTDAPRAWPLSSCISTLTAKINNTDVSINLNDVNQELLRYHDDIEILQNLDYSLSCAMQDQFQDYQNGFGSIRSPLAQYASNSYQFPRGGFVGLQSAVAPNTPDALGASTAQYLLTVVEPLFLSPFLFGSHKDQVGFIGVQTLDFNITLDNLQRLWSHDSVNGAQAFTVSAIINAQPVMYYNYITPQEITSVPRSLVLDYAEVNRYPTDYTPGSPVNSGVSFSVNSNNIQLNSIPRRMYVLARRTNAYRTPSTSDTYARMNSISVNWNNRSGLLSGADPPALYKMCIKNGCNLNWDQWYSYVGSVLCIDFGDDIGLNDLEAPGLLGTYQLQIQANFTNVSLNPVNYTMYIIIVSEGTFSITENRSVAQIGVISKQDVLDSKAHALMDYNMTQQIYGGNMFSSLKNVVSTALPYLSKALPCVVDVHDEYQRRNRPRPGARQEGSGVVGGRRHLRGGKLIGRDELNDELNNAEDEYQYEDDNIYGGNLNNERQTPTRQRQQQQQNQLYEDEEVQDTISQYERALHESNSRRR